MISGSFYGGLCGSQTTANLAAAYHNQLGLTMRLVACCSSLALLLSLKKRRIPMGRLHQRARPTLKTSTTNENSYDRIASFPT